MAGVGRAGVASTSPFILPISVFRLVTPLNIPMHMYLTATIAAGIKRNRPPPFEPFNSNSPLSSAPKLSLPSQSSSLSSAIDDLEDEEDDEDMLDEITVRIPGR